VGEHEPHHAALGQFGEHDAWLAAKVAMTTVVLVLIVAAILGLPLIALRWPG